MRVILGSSSNLSNAHACRCASINDFALAVFCFAVIPCALLKWQMLIIVTCQLSSQGSGRVGVLGEIGGEDAQSVLRALAGDRSSLVRRSAERSLSQLAES